jgi:GNAT superfamily N-acetyltransferase
MSLWPVRSFYVILHAEAERVSFVSFAQTACLEQVDFDSRAFGFPYYRLSKVDADLLPSEIAALQSIGRFAADGKFPSGDLATSRILMQCGFRKTCMQITLSHDLRGAFTPSVDVIIADRLELGEDEIYRHARNFTADRFALDPFLPSEGHDRVYAQWCRNSLGGAKNVASLGRNFCTFAIKEDRLIIDLVSILDPRQGLGSRILTSVLNHARKLGLRSVSVTTECENVAAWSLYVKQGFVPVSYTACFQYVYTPGGGS